MIIMVVQRNKKNNYILCYTRLPEEDIIYSEKLAYSMHLAYSDDGENFEPLNHNFGILFARATENDNGSLNAKSLKNPYIFYLADGTFGVVAVRTESDGTNDEESKGKVLVFSSSDLLQYEEIGLLDLKGDAFVNDVVCNYDDEKKGYIIKWNDHLGNYYMNFIGDILKLRDVSHPEPVEPFQLRSMRPKIQGVVPRNIIQVSEEIAHRLICKLTVPVNIKMEVPEKVIVKTERDLENVKAIAIYSDNTTDIKRVKWNKNDIDWSRPGVYRVTGTVHQDRYPFPIAIDRADPCITKWNGKYYFIATNDADGNHSLYIREADTIPGLVHAEEILILDSETYEDIKGLLWAPEFHIIGNDLYIFHGATSDGFYYEQSHVMKLRRGGNPTCANDWSRPYRVLKKDGTYLCEAGRTISLDMTVIPWNGEYYVVWSQREFIPQDLGAWLYIAKIDPNEPWKLVCDPTVLTKPEYGWENNNVFVVEGPFALIRDNRLFLTYSGSLIDETYVIGLLTAEKGSDLMDPTSWKKCNYPLLTSMSVVGEYGPGHNSYISDDYGVIWNVYHARPGIKAPRSSGIRRVHFDIDGYPRLDLTEDRDINKDLSKIAIDVVLV
ncbi:family 43 glycosylhydrolase [Anoxybacillus sp. LAT_35]|nr:family 43 glycosylhydrolase [Anoxybacillus sp. LAT_11]MCG6173550.1 family 43 glycosylhydrolase [Anoxybacillus sp. LAT_11]MCG6173888.1 family 43 glycosylhydrolase [Anoxybacillus sp. LAT_31]MCG6176784.1 family 43 glycosylhydrolase [Anoxybacillus sp. LAT_35]MCG6180365.1 family 43 glycosylhydrolase [Anoxybacillus sp. LAT_33]